MGIEMYKGAKMLWLSGLHGIKDRVQVDEMNKCVAGSWPHDKVQG